MGINYIDAALDFASKNSIYPSAKNDIEYGFIFGVKWISDIKSEISDDDVIKAAIDFSVNYSDYEITQDDAEYGFLNGVKWYKINNDQKKI